MEKASIRRPHRRLLQSSERPDGLNQSRYSNSRKKQTGTKGTSETVNIF